MLAVQFVMSVATEEGCHMAAETFGINYLASDTVQVKYPQYIYASVAKEFICAHMDFHFADILRAL